jgi:hypothetical protein
MPRQNISYAWARHVPLNDPRLSSEGREGLEYAQRLAEDALERSLSALEGRPMPVLTVEELSLSEDASPSTIRKRIEQARRELFGSLSDAGIYYRLRRARKLKVRPWRYCEALGCGEPLPAGATARRRFCAGSTCRTRSWRAAGVR